MAGSVAELLAGNSAPSASNAPPPPPPGFTIQGDAPPPPPPGFTIQGAAPTRTTAQAVATGFGKDARSALHGAGDIVDFVPDVLKAFWNLPGDVVQAVTGYDLGPRVPLHVTRDAADRVADQLNLPKDQNTLDRIGGAIIEGVTASGGIGGAIGALKGAPGFAGVVGRTAADPLVNTVTGATGGAAAQGVAEAGGGPVAQTVAGMLGGMAGGLGLHAASPKAVPVDAPVRPQGPLAKALAPFAAAVSKDAAATQAGQTLAEAATNPARVADALSKPGEIVPGSQPTTFQQTGDPGLGQLEREAAKANPDAFIQRAAEQNSARRGALDTVEPGGDPNDVAKALKQQFDDLNAEHDGKVTAATEAAQGRAASALGPEATPDGLGAELRGALSDAEDAARKSEGGLWKAVDPNGDLTGNVSATVQAAHDIPDRLTPTAKPIEGEEAAIFDAAQNMPPLSPLTNLTDLRSRVSSAMRNELIANGRTASYGRLSALRGAIEDNLAHTISQEIANETRQVKGGVVDPSQTVAARVQSWLHDWQSARAARPDDSAGVPGGSASGSPSAAGILRTESPAPEGSGSHGSPEGLPATAPTLDAEAGQRLAAASDATKQRAQTFGQGPVGQALQTNGSKDNFRLPNGSVAGKFFHPGASSFDHIQALLATGAKDALATIERYAATTLRRAALKADGTLDPAKFNAWRKSFADALRALPEGARAKFADAARAGETLADVQAKRAQALKEAQQGAIGKVMNLSEPEDVVRTVGQILSGRTAIADMKALAKATAGDPVARQGLRRAITDHIANKLVGNTEAGTSGEAQIKADAYQTFVRQNRAALHLVFTPDEVRSMEAVAADLQRSARSQNTKLAGQSNTPQDQHKAMNALMQAGQKSWLEIAGGVLGSHFGPLGTVGGIYGAHLIRSLRAAGVSRVADLVSQAMLDPALARELLKKAPRQPAHWNAGSGALIAALWGASQPKKDAR